MKNILFYIHRFPGYGGIEIVTTYLANFFVNHNNSVTIFSFSSSNKDTLLKDLDPKIVFVSASSKIVDDVQNEIQLRNVVDARNIDVVIFQDSYYPIETLLLKIKNDYKFKVWVVEHNTPDCKLLDFKNDQPHNAIKILKRKLFYPFYLIKIKKLVRIRTRRLYYSFDKYILLSKKYYPIWEWLTGIYDHPNLTFIFNPITIPLPERIINNKEKICLFCGRLDKQKGIRKLLNIWLMIEKNNPDWSLLIVGDGPEKEFVEKYVETHRINSIKLAGFQHDVAKYYMKSQILCMSSVYEGWLLTLNEAMIYGCIPILFNSYAAASEIVDNEVNGFLIAPYDEVKYANCLSSLMNNGELRTKMMTNARLNGERFSIDNVGRQWMDLLNE